MFNYKIGFIGGGNMGSAMALRFIESGAAAADSVIICDTNREKLDVFAAKGCAVTDKIADVITDAEITFLAIKPQAFFSLKEELKDKIRSEVVISILAGKKIASIKEVIGHIDGDVVRLMPNLACRYGKGVTLADMSELDNTKKERVEKMLSALGLLVETEEKDFNFRSAVSGCGPAFFFEYYKHFFNECVKSGMNEDIARKMVLQTAGGAAELALNSQETFDKLIANVCSKGGSTIEGVKVMQKSDLEKIVSETLAASKKRNDELENA